MASDAERLMLMGLKDQIAAVEADFDALRSIGTTGIVVPDEVIAIYKDTALAFSAENNFFWVEETESQIDDNGNALGEGLKRITVKKSRFDYSERYGETPQRSLKDFFDMTVEAAKLRHDLISQGFEGEQLIGSMHTYLVDKINQLPKDFEKRHPA